DILYQGSSGRRTFAPEALPFGTDSFTWIASLTKLITTTCIMQLVERGHVRLDDDLRGLVPELEQASILLGGLLTHTVGLAYDLADPDLTRWTKATGRTADNLGWSREGFNTPLKFHPGDAWCYGSSLDWAALALEKLTRTNLGSYMKENIFDVLGMRDTGFWPLKLPHVLNRSVAFSNRSDGVLQETPPPIPIQDHEIESGGAGLFSTAADYALFLQGFLQGKLLRQETLEAIFTPQLNPEQRRSLESTCYRNDMMHDAFAPEFPRGLPLDHGLGALQNKEDVPGKRRKGSLTWSGMCNSRWWVDRESGIAAVLFVNVLPHGDPVVKKLYNELETAVYGHVVAK
ncbi:beta-lactamase, partial [Stachybotrys elegans]